MLPKLEFPPNVSDRQRHELTIQYMKKLEELKKSNPTPQPVPPSNLNPDPQPQKQIDDDHYKKNIISTTLSENDLIPSFTSINITNPEQDDESDEMEIHLLENREERSWICSNCKLCAEWVPEEKDKCRCGCGHIFHLKEEDEYAPECIDDYNYSSEQEYREDDEDDEDEY